MVNIKEEILNFFEGLKCDINIVGDTAFIGNIPYNIQKMLNIKDKIELNFSDSKNDKFIDNNSKLYIDIKNLVKKSSSKTLLKIDFEFPSNIKNKINLRNCSVDKIEKVLENNYFSKFKFLTSFRYLNKIEQVTNELFIFEGKIINGDLSGYDVKEGDGSDIYTEHLSSDYDIAKNKLKEILSPKIEEVSYKLTKDFSLESHRIENHYNKLIEEIELNKNRLLSRLNDATESNDKEKEIKLKEAIELFDKNSNLENLKKEKNLALSSEKIKFGLDVDNKLINTSVIYYPIFKIYLNLSDAGFSKKIEAIYDPLKDSVNSFFCDACGSELEEINICHGGHLSCSSCLHTCGECFKRYCRKCFSGVCESCGKLICKNCTRECSGCKKLYCKSCMRSSDLTGGEKCVNCIGYCPICHKSSDKKRMVRGKSGMMVCYGCKNK